VIVLKYWKLATLSGWSATPGIPGCPSWLSLPSGPDATRAAAAVLATETASLAGPCPQGNGDPTPAMAAAQQTRGRS